MDLSTLMHTKEKMGAFNRMIRYTITGCALWAVGYGLSADTAHAAWAARDVKKGNALYEEEKYDAALKKYNKALESLPESDVVNFNAGSAHYKIGDYKEAEGSFAKSLLTEDRGLEAGANYNIGNAKYRRGEPSEKTEPEKAIKLYREALEYYTRAMELDKKDEDAKFNYEFVKKKLEELQKKQQEEEKEEKKEEDKKEKEEKKDKKEDKEDKDKQKEKEEEDKEKEKQEQDKKKEEKKREEKEREEEKKKEKEKEQKEREEKEKREKEKKEREKKKEEKKPPEQKPEPEEEMPGEMTENEARMLLEGHRQEEESKGKPVKLRKGAAYPDVIKNW